MALPVFDVQPEFVFSWERTPRVVVSDWREGVHHQRRVYDRTPRNFELVWRNMTSAQIASVRSFFDQTRGGAGAMTWTPPGEGAAVVVAFAHDGLRVVKRSAQGWSTTVRFEEVLQNDG